MNLSDDIESFEDLREQEWVDRDMDKLAPPLWDDWGAWIDPGESEADEEDRYEYDHSESDW